jgi:hypothetical protein
MKILCSVTMLLAIVLMAGCDDRLKGSEIGSLPHPDGVQQPAAAEQPGEVEQPEARQQTPLTEQQEKQRSEEEYKKLKDDVARLKQQVGLYQKQAHQMGSELQQLKLQLGKTSRLARKYRELLQATERSEQPPVDQVAEPE